MNLLVRILLCAALVSTSAGAGTELYVSNAGKDVWSGTIADPKPDGSDGPFATLERARGEIRRRKAAGALGESATVYLRGGDYFRDKTFELSAADGLTPATLPADGAAAEVRIAYRACRGEKVRLIGGRRIAKWEPVMDPKILARLDQSACGKVVQADLKAAGIKDFGKLTPRGFGRAVTPAHLELFFNGKPMTLARWPNEGWVKTTGAAAEGGKFNYDGDRPLRWRRAEDIWVHGYWTWDWADSHERVKGIDTKRREIATEPPHGVYGYKPGKRYYAFNLLEEIDQPGEWYLDRKSGILYFWPPAPDGEALVSTLDTMIRMRDVNGVGFEGITIEAVRGTAVEIVGGEHNRVAGCSLRSIGNLAVTISGGSRNCVVGCDITHTGDGGISLSGGDRPTLKAAGHCATNNDIADFSRWDITYRPAISVSGVGQHVSHNLIHDAPHMGIALGGNEHVLEFNEIHHVCMDTDDAGAFYMGRDWTQRGNVIRHNYFHHIGRTWMHVGVMAVYLDDWSSGTIVYGNVFYKAGRAAMIGGGRDNTVENNVFVECTPSVHVDSRGLGWAKSYFDGRDDTLVKRLNDMPFKQPPWSTRYPQLVTLYDDEPAVAKGNVIARNISVGGKWLDLLDGLTGKIVRVENNLVDIDPHFVDAAAQDFRLRPESPAWKIGFQAIPCEKIGLQRDSFRTSCPTSRPNEN